MTRPLLILDLDETLVHASDGAPIADAHFAFDRFTVLKRPSVDAFVAQVAEWFDLAVWTSSTSGYARHVIDRIFPDPAALRFAWFHDRCTSRYDVERQEYYGAKNLDKVKRRGFALERTLIIDDSPEKLRSHYGNHVRVTPFTGDPTDTELRDLLPFLDGIRTAANFRDIEKRAWRSRTMPPRGDVCPK